MSAKDRTEVHFRSDVFNRTEPRDYFINDCCFGDDVCLWLIKQLRACGLRTADAPGQEDFGWYFRFHVGEVEHSFVLGLSEGDTPGDTFWRGWLERPAGSFASILGRNERGVHQAACDAIHDVLTSCDRIHHISWHIPDDLDDELVGAPRPNVNPE